MFITKFKDRMEISKHPSEVIISDRSNKNPLYKFLGDIESLKSLLKTLGGG